MVTEPSLISSLSDLSSRAPTQAFGLVLGVLFVSLIAITLVWWHPWNLRSRAASGERKPTLAGRLLIRLLPLISVAALLSVVATAFVVSTASSSGLLFLALAGIFFLLSAATLFVVVLELQPLRWLAKAATGLARNDLAARITVDPATRKDELGQLAEAIQRMTLGLGAGMEEIARLVEVSQAVSPRSNLSQTLPILLRGVLRSLAPGAAGFHYVENGQGAMRNIAREGEMALPAAVEGSIERLSRQVWRTAAPVVLPQVQAGAAETPRDALAQSNVRSLAIFPMLREGRTIGTLWAAWDAPREFSPMDRSFMTTLANLAGIMIESHQVYRAAQGQRQRLDAILAATRDGILVTDAEGRLEMANPAAQELLGFDAKTCAGEPLRTVLNHERVFMLVSDLSRDRGPSAVEIERDSRRLHVSAAKIKLVDQSLPQSWVFVLRDITSVKDKDAMQTDFLGTLSHSMRSPLQFVRGYASMMKQAGPTTSTQDEYVKKILKGIDDLTRLIDEQLELDEISSGRGLTKTPCQLVTLAAKVVDAMSPYAEGKGLTLRSDFAANPPQVIGDPTRLEHTIRNLVDNAIKYTNAPGWVKITVQESPSSVVVSVSDSGIGMAQADLHRIFEPGFRIRRKETLHIHGTGNGLAIVKKTIEQHCGQVWVESQVGSGSTFHMALPKERRLSDLLGEGEQTTRSTAPAAGDKVAEQRPARDAEAGMFL